ncbi:uncharacterized protein (TIGR04255 family) [Solirubrobacter pauli]|uniref:Uncharacterized protein (TIGR04255 family) n=1 Tax=Solirubrobacter pauli TaxID=166793 RepID=A0A660LIM6_9ACTN|nr:TIGR04255 family protein [Solirubrobacter pauli]RKQ92984.1 uncharacterized protein (TIGR04255 family) [Solirubrobacter pauli]
MIADLPEPQHEHLASAPLELAVWQLQFSEPAAVQDPAVGTQVAEALASDGHGAFQLTRLSSQMIFAFASGQAPQPPESVEPDGWQLRRGQLVVNLNRQSLSVETTAYQGWDRFSAVFGALCRALEVSAVDLPGEQRLGLRYVDRISLPGVRKPADWEGLLAPWLVASMTHEHLGDAVLAAAGQVELAVEEGSQATLRYRAFPDFERRGRQTVMLDFDTFRQGYRTFSTQTILDTSNQFHDVAHRLFEASITSELRAVFGREKEASA